MPTESKKFRIRAKVWFDQVARPDRPQLDCGLRGSIAEHDIFLLCASRELFENAGYALQELAWALDLQATGEWTGVICVARFLFNGRFGSGKVLNPGSHMERSHGREF